MKNLTYLDLSNNNLKGEIPITKYGELKNLTYLDLSNNNLEGRIPKSFSKLKKLELLDLGGNTLDYPFFKILNSLPNLANLSIWGNKWHTDGLPIFLSQLYIDDNNSYFTKKDRKSGKVDETFKPSSGWDQSMKSLDSLKKISKTSIRILDGIFTEWYSENNKKTELLIEYGILNSVNHWDKDGNQLITNGEGIFRRYIDDFLFMEAVKNNLMVGDWTVYQGDNQKYCVVEFNDFNGRTEHHHYEAFGLYLENGRIKELYYEGGEKHFELTKTGYKSYFVDGSIYIEKFVNKDGNQVVFSNGQLGPHSMINNWGHMTFPKALSYKNNYSSEFTLLSNQHPRVKRILNGCLPTVLKTKLNVKTFLNLDLYLSGRFRVVL